MTQKTQTFRSHGKLLLTAEYAVLDGAKALAIPTKYGQSLAVTTHNNPVIDWTSYNECNEVWFSDQFEILKTSEGLQVQSTSKSEISLRLIQIFSAIQRLNPNFLSSDVGYSVTTHQDFNRAWGLGTSSTLINNMAHWAKVDAYKLLALTFGGSGYDIACAQHDTALTFQLEKESAPKVAPVAFDPNFKDQLYFVYLNAKQNSRDGIASYRKLGLLTEAKKEAINNITANLEQCTSRVEFDRLIHSHEQLISELIAQQPIQQRLFSDFKGAIKSLGAWGGDFILVSSEADPRAYFKTLGYPTIIPYSAMVL
ncbi:GYDIA family GHMP kinase [Winogradskyella rapida]|uniref:GYDIA family GHMP kinase n=1 Tax=Winogradskyella rapida TaxID=549701 RepID=A0ABW3KRE8_9FLAO